MYVINFKLESKKKGCVMKTNWYFISVLFLISITFVFVDWNVDGFNFFKFQEQHFYFQSWISLGGVLFTFVMAITMFIIYKKTKLQSLKYTSLSFLLTATAYSIIGYHASYCKVCSDLGLCAASHNYPLYLIIITLIIFILTIIMLSHSLDIVKKTQLLRIFSYGLIIATTLLIITLFISLQYLETPDSISYIEGGNNLQAFMFLLPVVVIVWVFVYFRNMYKVSGIYLLMALLLSLSFLPQIFHIYMCKDCYTMECSEFYAFSGLIMFIIIGLFIHSVSTKLQKDSEEL